MQPHQPKRPRVDPATLGRRIVKRRTDLGVDQGELAIRSELSRAYISRLENGLVPNPKLFDLEQVARVLDIPLPELVAPEVELVETRYSLDFDEIERRLAERAATDPERAESVMRLLRTAMEVALGADDAVRRN